MKKYNPSSKKNKSAAWRKTRGLCYYCGVKLRRTKRYCKEQFDVDHLVPRKRGGGDELSNLVPACRTCNTSKNDFTVEEYRNHKKWQQLGIGKKFTDQQKIFLLNHGLDVDAIIAGQTHTFFFETMLSLKSTPKARDDNQR